MMLRQGEAYLVTRFSFNVSVLATNRSCLLVLMLLRFAGFHRQPLSGLLRGLLYLEVRESRSASGIELKKHDIPKVVVIYFVLRFALFFGRQKIFLCSALSVPTAYRGTSSRKISTCATLLRARRSLLQRLGLLVSSGAHISRDIERRCASC